MVAVRLGHNMVVRSSLFYMVVIPFPENAKHILPYDSQNLKKGIE